MLHHPSPLFNGDTVNCYMNESSVCTGLTLTNPFIIKNIMCYEIQPPV
jgi:hypothetical protein